MNKIQGVYLIECPYDGINMFKIGCSGDIIKRLKTHKSSNPLIENLGYIKSNNYKLLEKDIHHRCRKFKYKGEWFYKNKDITEYFQNHENFEQL